MSSSFDFSWKWLYLDIGFDLTTWAIGGHVQADSYGPELALALYLGPLFLHIGLDGFTLRTL